MVKQIKINISNIENKFNIKSSIEEFIESIDWNDKKTQKFKIIFENEDKDVTEEWKERVSYKKIKSSLEIVIHYQNQYHQALMDKFSDFKSQFKKITTFNKVESTDEIKL